MRTFGRRRRSSGTRHWSGNWRANTVLSLQYAGARGLHLYDIKNFNALAAAMCCLATQRR